MKMEDYGVQPKKKDILRLFDNKEDLDRVARLDVAINMILGIAMQYEDEVNEILGKYNLVIGGLKREYKRLDKAFKEYDDVFRSVILKGTEYKYGNSFIELQCKVDDFVEDNMDKFNELYPKIKEMVSDYVNKNFAQDTCVENANKLTE